MTTAIEQLCGCEVKPVLWGCQAYLMFGSAPCCSNSFKQRVFLSVSLPTARCIAATPLPPTRSGHAPRESSSCTDLPRNVSCYEGTHSMLTYLPVDAPPEAFREKACLGIASGRITWDLRSSLLDKADFLDATSSDPLPPFSVQDWSINIPYIAKFKKVSSK